MNKNYYVVAFICTLINANPHDPDTLFAQAQYDQAASLYEQYIQRASVNYAQCLIALGLDEHNPDHWLKAWPAFDERLPLEYSLNKREPLLKPLPYSQDPSGCIILARTEYGAGDTYTFVRYLKLLKQMGAKKVIVMLQPSQRFLSHMLARCNYIDQVIEHDEVLPFFDYDVYLMSLPGLISTKGITATTPDTVYHSDAPYLYADPDAPIKVAPNKVNIALSWRASKNPVAGGTRIIDRDIPLELLLNALKDIPNVELYSIQGSRGYPVKRSLINTTPPTDMCDIIPDDAPNIIVVHDDKDKPLKNTMAIIAQCDAVVSVDTGYANLAAAMGTRTFFLLKKENCDMRWGTQRNITPWYDSAVLLRQEVEGDWGKPLDELREFFFYLKKHQ